MNNSISNLTAVIPIRGMFGKLSKLRETLLSIGDLPVNIILVHDDAQDGTQEELENLVNDFRYLDVQLKNVSVQSPGLARNEGIESTLTDWICFWDSDDLPNVRGYVELLRLTLAEGALIGIGQIASVGPGESTDEKLHAVSDTRSNLVLQIANMPAFTRFIFHRSVVQNIRFNSLRAGEDQCFLRDTNFFNYSHVITPEIIYRYFTSTSGQLSQDSNAKLDGSKALSILCKDYNHASGRMIDFSFAQIVKLFLGVVNEAIRSKDLVTLASSLFGTMTILIKRPIFATRCIRFFSTNRINLAGR